MVVSPPFGPMKLPTQAGISIDGGASHPPLYCSYVPRATLIGTNPQAFQRLSGRITRPANPRMRSIEPHLRAGTPWTRAGRRGSNGEGLAEVASLRPEDCEQ